MNYKLTVFTEHGEGAGRIAETVHCTVDLAPRTGTGIPENDSPYRTLIPAKLYSIYLKNKTGILHTVQYM